LRRQAHNRRRLNAIGTHLLDNVGDVGTPISHANVDADRLASAMKFHLDKASLFECDLSERAAANERVAVLDLFDDLLWKRPAADHVAQIFGNLLDGLRGSVGKEEYGLFRHARSRYGEKFVASHPNEWLV
jgi:hypothetical protein